MKLTPRVVAGLAKEKIAQERIVWDDELSGLGLRMRPGGSRNWVYQYKLGTKQRRITLGALSAVGLVKARQTAGDLHAKVRLGQDPAVTKAQTKEQASETFDVVAKRFLAHKEARVSETYYDEMKRHLLTYAKKLHSLPLKSIKRSNVAALLSDLRSIHSDGTADHTRASLSSLFAWALKEGLLGDEAINPVIYTYKGKQGTRERVLTIEELREVWQATAKETDYNQIIRLLMFSLQRRGEIGSLDRNETDFGNNLITLPPKRTKNKHEHKIPMSAPIVAVLKKRRQIVGHNLFFGIGKQGYKGWSKSKKELDDRILAAREAKFGNKAQPMSWRLHDLRRTGDTLMNDELGIDPHVVEAILNHVSGEKSAKDGVAGVYNKAAYIAKKKAALDAWAVFILSEVATSTTSDDRPSAHQDDVRIDEPTTALPVPVA
jgi:integrase